MASPAPPVSAGSTLGAMNSSGTTRTGWGPKNTDPNAAFRGIGRGRGRGGRGGHHSGRPAPSRGGHATAPEVERKSPQDAKPKAPSVSPKVPASAPTTSTPDPATSKPTRPRPSRKASEPKASRKPSLSVDPVVPPAANTSTSTSPRTPSRRKRSHTHHKDKVPHPPPAIISGLPRKPSFPAELNSTSARTNNIKSVPAPPPKDLPPHLAPQSTTAPTFDISHDIDALVERVRAGAMDRPHTPGSHLDWAGDDDDSLPDLDDWGITSSTTTATTDSSKASVISPILQDALKPLPSIIDIDVPTPSIKLHEVNGAQKELEGADGSVSVGERTPRTDGGLESMSQASTTGADADTETQSEISAQDARSSTFSPEPPLAKDRQADGTPAKGVSGVDAGASAKPATGSPIASPKAVRANAPDFFSDSSSVKSPDRALTASIHAVSASTSPNHLSPPPSLPLRGGFQPSHARAHTVGRYRQEYLSDSERPRRADLLHGHGRNHSTPPAGAGTGHSHSRTSSRPVITGDAISRLARTLGGSGLAKRDSPSTTASTSSPNSSKAS